MTGDRAAPGLATAKYNVEEAGMLLRVVPLTAQASVMSRVQLLQYWRKGNEEAKCS